jgi:phosphopantothenoylcysteine decarboxylase/phosphopantothenate--cysteine ligase
MNVNMYQNPLYQDNEKKLRKHGYHFADPIKGSLACGWEGEGKFQDPAVIFEQVRDILSVKDLKKETILVTAGPTREDIDPVRFISNHSSGKMGYALARAARRRGAEVILVTGPTALAPPPGVTVVTVVSAEEMRKEVLARVSDCSIVIKAAAVADYRPERTVAKKIKKSGETMELKLVKTTDILAELGKKKGKRLLVGFAAETDRLLENAAKKLADKNLDMVVANDVKQPGAGFNVDTNIVRLVYRNGKSEEIPLMAKEELAGVILDRVSALRRQK